MNSRIEIADLILRATEMCTLGDLSRAKNYLFSITAADIELIRGQTVAKELDPVEF